jgi:hypothetical protein
MLAEAQGTQGTRAQEIQNNLHALYGLYVFARVKDFILSRQGAGNAKHGCYLACERKARCFLCEHCVSARA